MANTCTCSPIVVGHHGPSEARNIHHACPEHGDAAQRAALDAMDPTVAMRGTPSTAARFRLLADLMRAEADRIGPARKKRLREIATAALLCWHQARREEIAEEQAVRRG